MRAGRARHLNRRTFLKGLGATAGVWFFGQNLVHGQQTLTLGVLGGSSVPLGQGIINGAQLAADELKFKVIVGDLGNESDPTRARTVLSDLAKQGADAIVGFSRSEGIPGLLLEVPRLKKPIVITGTASLGTDQVAKDYNSFKYLFRAGIVNNAAQAWDGGQFGGDFLNGLLKSGVVPGKGEVALIGDPSAASTEFRGMLANRLARSDLTVVGNFADAQPLSLLNRLQQVGVSAAITVFFDAAFGATFATAWSQNKVKIALFGWNAALLADDLKGAAAGYVVADFAAEATAVGPKTAALYRNYQAKFGARPVYTATTTYDTVYALADALGRARSTDGDALVRGLEAARMAGVVGLIRFYSVEEQNRDPLKLAVAHDQVYGMNRTGGAPAFDGARPFYTQITSDGQRTVLYPNEYATGKYTLPPHFA